MVVVMTSPSLWTITGGIVLLPVAMERTRSNHSETVASEDWLKLKNSLVKGTASLYIFHFMSQEDDHSILCSGKLSFGDLDSAAIHVVHVLLRVVLFGQVVTGSC